jgi:hypothetical protein
MRTAAVLLALLSWLPAPVWQSQSQPSTSDASGKHQAPMTLAGCVSPKPANGNFTFTTKDGTKYQLSGKNLKKYAGQEVEIVGGEGKKLTIKGGLMPSPNVAAQAGAMDPTQAAIAAQSAGTGSDLPVLTVSSVRGVSRSCQ